MVRMGAPRPSRSPTSPDPDAGVGAAGVLEGGAELVILADSVVVVVVVMVVMDGLVLVVAVAAAREVEEMEAMAVVVLSATIVADLVIWLGIVINKAVVVLVLVVVGPGDTAVAVGIMVAVAVVEEGVIIVERKVILQGIAQTSRLY